MHLFIAIVNHLDLSTNQSTASRSILRFVQLLSFWLRPPSTNHSSRPSIRKSLTRPPNRFLFTFVRAKKNFTSFLVSRFSFLVSRFSFLVSIQFLYIIRISQISFFVIFSELYVNKLENRSSVNSSTKVDFTVKFLVIFV